MDTTFIDNEQYTHSDWQKHCVAQDITERPTHLNMEQAWNGLYCVVVVVVVTAAHHDDVTALRLSDSFPYRI